MHLTTQVQVLYNSNLGDYFMKNLHHACGDDELVLKNDN
jgi:hypothetical protein